VTNPVQQALQNARLAEASPFQRFCIFKNLQDFPAAPSTVAGFVLALAYETLPIEKIWPYVQEISQAHLASGVADPTAGGQVAVAINSIANIDPPPRSWPAAEKARFLELPYDMQKYCAGREAMRDKEIRRAQNRAADAERKLKSLEKTSVIAEEKPAERPDRAIA
jgi:hypothetical protein